MTRKYLSLTAILAAGAFMAGCASTTGASDDDRIAADDPRLGERVNNICFARSIDRFSTVSDRQVILQTGPNREYLVETGACFQLDRAQRIGLDNSSGCVSRGDILIVSEQIFGNSAGAAAPDRCFIQAIYEWNPDAGAGED